MTRAISKNPQKRSKSYGYETEVATLRVLASIFPDLKRVGSVGYSRAHADLVQGGHGSYKLDLVVTRDKGGPLLVTMSMADFCEVYGANYDPDTQVRVQVKGRKGPTWIGSLYRELKKSGTS